MGSVPELGAGHPVRVYLNEASLGRSATRQQLDDALIRDDVVDGADLNRHRARLVAGIRRVAEVAETGDFQRARQLAEQVRREIAAQMSEEERAVSSTVPNDKQEDIGAIGARMFGR